MIRSLKLSFSVLTLLTAAALPAQTMTPYGTGCGTPQLTLQPGPFPPTIGTGYAMINSGFGVGAPLWLAFGSSAPPAPIDLASVGAPGCSLLLDPLIVLGLSNFSDPISVGLWMPNDPNLVGQHFYFQSLAWRPSANALGLIFSNGLDIVVGT